MSFTVGTIAGAPGVTGTLIRLLAGRTVSQADGADWVRKAILELTEDYPFPQLEANGPIVNFDLTIGAGPYPLSFLELPADAGIEINKINSFFVYYNVYNAPLTASNGINPGYPMKYKTIGDMEMEINTLGLPVHWTRSNDAFWFGFSPNMNYPFYARYQFEHPFPNAGTVNAYEDPILMPNSWQDIVEYASAERAANELRLYDIASGYHTTVFGDPLFERSGGTQGCPGLLFKRTSQRERDQTTTTKQMRVTTRAAMRR
jgi:hypothetical protein